MIYLTVFLVAFGLGALLLYRRRVRRGLSHLDRRKSGAADGDAAYSGGLVLFSSSTDGLYADDSSGHFTGQGGDFGGGGAGGDFAGGGGAGDGGGGDAGGGDGGGGGD